MVFETFGKPDWKQYQYTNIIFSPIVVSFQPGWHSLLLSHCLAKRQFVSARFSLNVAGVVFLINCSSSQNRQVWFRFNPKTEVVFFFFHKDISESSILISESSIYSLFWEKLSHWLPIRMAWLARGILDNLGPSNFTNDNFHFLFFQNKKFNER